MERKKSIYNAKYGFFLPLLPESDKKKQFARLPKTDFLILGYSVTDVALS